MKIDLPSGGYTVDVGQDIVGKVADYARGRAAYVVTDKNVAALWLEALRGALGGGFKQIVLPAGEKTKSLQNTAKICRDLAAKGFGRDALLIAFGGGVAGDLGGFAAAVYQRGIDYLQVPTTLLAAVDSAVGGKTGVNLAGLKNYIGAFKQPIGVVADTRFFGTLPPKEITNGLGEVVKTALLDAQIFTYVKEYLPDIAALRPPHIEEAVRLCVARKGAIVARDEKEADLRKTLNAGHTIGHALESADNFRRGHGYYVLCGIYHECALAARLGLADTDYAREVQALSLAAIGGAPLPLRDKQKLTALMRRDKKNSGGEISFILPIAYGKVREVKLGEGDLWTD